MDAEGLRLRHNTSYEYGSTAERPVVLSKESEDALILSGDIAAERVLIRAPAAFDVNELCVRMRTSSLSSVGLLVKEDPGRLDNSPSSRKTEVFERQLVPDEPRLPLAASPSAKTQFAFASPLLPS
ncbi:hypothetical protein FOZ60_008297 [Perkinsus olseni]|uniref:Uncharacterized protein n=1 Tax=Perkinsus olseni TaxID=32597 RepID=A0A7J6NJK4_PEROL|nr:hypothetical protein FOZ60_008297 [Perkinsus olseni]